jgi:uncharacterized repeat protein (TIGR03837 family)
MLWDIFCKVIDNHGDVGVCWRLSAQLAARGEKVRLWIDDPSALAWMAPEGAAGVQVLPWQQQRDTRQCGDVVIEAFGCELEPAFQGAMATRTAVTGRQPPWINLEYLTAEPFGQRNHGLPSPVFAGPAKGLTKYFYYPGFVQNSGGLLREQYLLGRQSNFGRGDWLRAQGISPTAAHLVSLFCYEPTALRELLLQFATATQPTLLLVTAGRAGAATREVLARLDLHEPGWNDGGQLTVHQLPPLSQVDYDHLLWVCDLNLVRGEDSLVRALWAGKPFVWQIYPQHDDAHHTKLHAFLDWLDPPDALRMFFCAWNGIAAPLPPADFEPWAACAQRARKRLMAQDDLVTQLVRFVAGKQGRP